MEIIGRIILSLVLIATLLTHTDHEATEIKEAKDNQFSFSLNMPMSTRFEVNALTIQKVEATPKPVKVLSAKSSPKTKEIEYEIYEVTAYTLGEESTGKSRRSKNYGITASGEMVKENHTIACPKSLPFGTEIEIHYFDNTFTCLDRGGAIKEGRLDVYMKDLDAALEFGRRKLKVHIIKTE